VIERVGTWAQHGSSIATVLLRRSSSIDLPDPTVADERLVGDSRCAGSLAGDQTAPVPAHGGVAIVAGAVQTRRPVPRPQIDSSFVAVRNVLACLDSQLAMNRVRTAGTT